MGTLYLFFTSHRHIEADFHITRSALPLSVDFERLPGSTIEKALSISAERGHGSLSNLRNHISALDAGLHGRRVSLHFLHINAFRKSLLLRDVLRHFHALVPDMVRLCRWIKALGSL